jgi:plasmid stabilization system protein ParE
VSGYLLAGPARDDIRSIWQQIHLESGVGANRVVDRIFASCDHLGTVQTEGEEWPGRPPGMRYYAVPNTRYVLVFVPNTDPVEVIAVVDARRNLPDVPLD